MEHQLSEKESLSIISEMISQAKRNYQKGGGFQFLLWGWAVMLANLGHYYLQVFTDYSYPYVVWSIMIPAGIVSMVYSFRSNNDQVKSHMDRLYGHIWISAGVGMFVALAFMKELAFNHNAIILLLAAIATYISGQLLKFKPLIFGALALLIGTVVCFFVPVYQQTLVAGVSIFLGYIIPGYQLKKFENE